MAPNLAPAREGQEFQLSCVSAGANPEPNMTWFRNELQLTPGPGLRIEQSSQNGSATSTLTWMPSLDDHQASYKCQVWNKAMGSLSAHEREIRLQVECKYARAPKPAGRQLPRAQCNSFARSHAPERVLRRIWPRVLTGAPAGAHLAR